MKRILAILAVLAINSQLLLATDTWIRINQLGYLPQQPKTAVLTSLDVLQITSFSLCDVMSGDVLYTSEKVTNCGAFGNYKSTFRLDFSDFQQAGYFYIRADATFSPNFAISSNVYADKADFVLNFLRQQHGRDVTGFYSTSTLVSVTPPLPTDGDSTIKPKPRKIRYAIQRPLNITGGWREADEVGDTQYTATTATIVYQLLYAYNQNPSAFADKFDNNGAPTPNGIPDVLDEAKRGIDFLLSMSPSADSLFVQIGHNADTITSLPLYLSNNQPQGSLSYKNNSNGSASLAGKIAAAYALASDVLTPFFTDLPSDLLTKAIDIYNYGKQKTGVCQTVPGKTPQYMHEENWVDDMELAAAQIYWQTFETDFLNDAIRYGRKEPVIPWMGATETEYYQWYPFVNIGHVLLSTIENPDVRFEFISAQKASLSRLFDRSMRNPFRIGVPLVQGSNNMAANALIQCLQYRKITGDNSFISMENALCDWIFGCNPWGTSMVCNLPQTGKTPTQPHFASDNAYPIGGLVGGAINPEQLAELHIETSSVPNTIETFHSEWGVYNDDAYDFATNTPSLDGTASLCFYLANRQDDQASKPTTNNNLYASRALVRTDSLAKQIHLLFVGDHNAQNIPLVTEALNKAHAKAAFFFTGRFYSNKANKKTIQALMAAGHYMGLCSDPDQPYTSLNGGQLLTNQASFEQTIKNDYAQMRKWGITASKAPFFTPAYGAYNEAIALWAAELGLKMVVPTPETFTLYDDTTPEMRENYYSSNEIYTRLMQREVQSSLNGCILLMHLDTDERRTDNFCTRLPMLLSQFTSCGYKFVPLSAN